MNEWWQMVLSLFKRYPRAFISLGCAIILAGLVYWRLQSLPALETAAEETSRTWDVVLRNQSQGAELGEQLKELKRLTSGMENRLMSIDSKALNYQFFYDIESRSRASISTLKQGGAELGDGGSRAKLSEFAGLNFELTVSGRVGYVMMFLKRLESGKYFVRCNGVQLKGNPTMGADAVDATLKLEVLAKKP